MTPASREGNMYVRDTTALDDQRLEALRGGNQIRPRGALGVDTGVINLTLDGCLCRESECGQLESSKRWQGEGS